MSDSSREVPSVDEAHRDPLPSIAIEEQHELTGSRSSLDNSEDSNLLEVQSGASYAVAESKSMENILLETSPVDESIDLGSQSTFAQSSAISASNEDLLPDDTEAVTSDLEGEAPQMAEGSSPKISFKMGECPEAEDYESTVEDTEALEYFKSDEPDREVSDDIFGHASQEGRLSEERDHAEESLPESDSSHHSKPHLHFSVSREEEVSFEEEKGEGLKPTMSTRSLSKFFTTEAGGTDTEGKSFFDTFTASDGDDPLGMSSSPRARTTSERESDLPSSPSSGLAPETPPFPGGTAPMSPTFGHQLSSESAKEGGSLVLDDATFPNSPPESLQVEDDAFSASIKASEADRQRDAWIPSEATRQALVSLLTHPSTVIPPEQRTRPGLIIDDPQVSCSSSLQVYKRNHSEFFLCHFQGDPVKDLVQKYISEHEANKRKTLTADDVTPDEEGLNALMVGHPFVIEDSYAIIMFQSCPLLTCLIMPPFQNAECWRAAVDLTGRILTKCGQGLGKVGVASQHTPFSLKVRSS